MQQIGKLASVLQSTSTGSPSKRRCIDTVDILMEVKEAELLEQPTQQTVAVVNEELEKNLLAGREVPGLRQEFRMAQTNILDYGKDFNKDLLTGHNILVSTELICFMFLTNIMTKYII